MTCFDIRQEKERADADFNVAWERLQKESDKLALSAKKYEEERIAEVGDTENPGPDDLELRRREIADRNGLDDEDPLPAPEELERRKRVLRSIVAKIRLLKVQKAKHQLRVNHMFVLDWNRSVKWRDVARAEKRSLRSQSNQNQWIEDLIED